MVRARACNGCIVETAVAPLGRNETGRERLATAPTAKRHTPTWWSTLLHLPGFLSAGADPRDMNDSDRHRARFEAFTRTAAAGGQLLVSVFKAMPEGATSALSTRTWPRDSGSSSPATAPDRRGVRRAPGLPRLGADYLLDVRRASSSRRGRVARTQNGDGHRRDSRRGALRRGVTAIHAPGWSRTPTARRSSTLSTRAAARRRVSSMPTAPSLFSPIPRPCRPASRSK